MMSSTDMMLDVPAATRLNIGCGRHPLLYWCNIDSDPSCPSDLCRTVPPIPYPDGSLDEIYAGHFLEHLTREEADQFVAECYRCLKPGGRLGIVVPDLDEIMRRHLDPDTDGRVEFPVGQWRNVRNMDDLCDLFIFSTTQDSHHKWHYDRNTLPALLVKRGFKVTGEINKWLDKRIEVGAWYQFGFDATKVGGHKPTEEEWADLDRPQGD